MDETAADRARLVDEVRAKVRATHRYLGKDALDERVLAALARIPREEFLPAGERECAYADTALGIGYQQTISAPYIVAVMTDLLGPQADDVVLEVGTGSGYQSAVLAGLVARVYTLETVQPLAEAAARRLKRLGVDNVEVRWGDGRLGWPEHAPYDGIIVTAAAPEVPAALMRQLKSGGHLVVPVGPIEGPQTLLLIAKDEDGRLSEFGVLPVAFVPLLEATPPPETKA